MGVPKHQHREPGFIPLSVKMGIKPKPIRDLVSRRHSSQRNELGATSADLELGFLRGYQGGYEDAAAGRPPKHYARADTSKQKKRKKKSNAR